MSDITIEFAQALDNNPKLSGKELFDMGLATSERTGRRWKRTWRDTKRDQIMHVAHEQAKLLEQIDPVFTIETVDKSSSEKPVGVVFSSCMHIGSRYTNHEALQEYIDWLISIPNLCVVSLGDEAEGYIPSFRDAGAVMNQALPIPLQHEALRLMIEHLVEEKRLLWGMASQHGTEWLEKRSGQTPVKDMYLDQDIPFFDGQGYVKFLVGEQVYWVASSHEFPGSSYHNKTYPHARAQRENFPSANLIVQGDKHTYATSETTMYGWEVEAGLRKSPFVHYLQAGTAKDGPDKYTMKRWSRGVFEWPIAIFDNNSHHIEVTRHRKTVEAWLT